MAELINPACRISLKWRNKPVCLLFLGMPKSGKSTLVGKIASCLSSKNLPPYLVNLDPAVRDIPYQPNSGNNFIFALFYL